MSSHQVSMNKNREKKASEKGMRASKACKHQEVDGVVHAMMNFAVEGRRVYLVFRGEAYHFLG